MTVRFSEYEAGRVIRAELEREQKEMLSCVVLSDPAKAVRQTLSNGAMWIHCTRTGRK